MTAPHGPGDPPVVRLVRGTATDEEIAALTVVLVTSAAGAAPEPPPVLRPRVGAPVFDCPRSWQRRH